jgi:hypothetical protein
MKKMLCGLALLIAGCGSSSAPVTLHFQDHPDMPPMPNPGSGYTAPTGTVGTNQDQQLVLDSTAGGAEFKISVDAPSQAGDITVGNAHLEVEYTLSPSGPTFVSNLGTVTFNTITSPYSLTFTDLEVIGSGATGAAGVFRIDGTGQYTQ